MSSYEDEIDPKEFDRMLQEELVIGDENLDALQYLRMQWRQRVYISIGIAVVLMTALAFLIYSLTSQSSRFIAPVFEPFVVPVCVIICFLLYNVYLEYQRVSTELHQLSFFTSRLQRATSYAQRALSNSDV